MSTISVDYDVLNQKGSPAWFSDTFANIPTAGYKGRMFISIDTYAFYRDTGTGWDLIGGPGTGTLTGSGATGQVSFFNGTQTITGNNNLFWDNTNSRLGINTATPGAPLDIHGTGTQLQLNGTGANNSYLTFQNAGTSKWRIGNTYNAGANSFDIYIPATNTTPLSISSLGAITLTANVNTTGTQFVGNGLYITYVNGGSLAGNTLIWGKTDGLNFNLGNGTGGASFIFQTAAIYDYTFPATTGTLALTSNLSAYLPLAGGTLTGALIGTSATFSDLIVTDTYANDPLIKLATTTSGNVEVQMRTSTTSYNAGIGVVTSGYDFGLFTNNTTRMTITSAGNVGIGTSSPGAKLDVKTTGTGSSFTDSLFLHDSSVYQNGFTISHIDGVARLMSTYAGSGINSDMTFWTTTSAGAQGERMRIASNGQVQITQAGNGYITGGLRLTNTGSQYWTIVNGTNNNLYLGYNNNDSGNFSFTTGVYTPLSDINKKKDFEDSTIGLNAILGLKPTLYRMKSEDETSDKHLGFIAQEVKEFIPQAYSESINDENTFIGLDYQAITSALVKAIQELNEKLVRNNIN